MPSENRQLKSLLRKASRGIGRVSDSQDRSPTRKLRSSKRPKRTDRVMLQLVEVDGLLQWEEVTHAPSSSRSVLKRRAGGPARRDDGAIANLEFDRLEPSKITSFLSSQDLNFVKRGEKKIPGVSKLPKNYSKGLRRWDAKKQALVIAEPPKSGQVLLLVHGTFSNGAEFIHHFLSEESTNPQKLFLNQALKKYNNNVFVYDHPTLSVGPLFNAMDLDWAFADSNAEIDVISHSRGGLVTRWWCEHVHRSRCRRVFLAGVPSGGTGLAAPPRLRATIDLMTKFSGTLETLSGWSAAAVPMMSVVTGLLRVVTSVTSILSKTPIVDALIAMVPGIFAMSRVGNNPELLRLREGPPSNINQYYAIASNFAPKSPGWAFWKWFNGKHIGKKAADLVFDGDNDLVIDTSSMTDLFKKELDTNLASERILTFKNSEDVHHLNYFRQVETLDFLRKHLKL